MAPRVSKKKAAEQAEMAVPAYEEIALRAYEIHESGEGDGPLEDWLRAERELTPGGEADTQIAA